MEDELLNMEKELDAKTKALLEKNLDLEKHRNQKKLLYEHNSKLSETINH